MPESFWESQATVEAQPETAESQPAAEPQEQAADAGALAVSVDDFSALEERILRAVGLVKEERLARTAAETRAEQAETELLDQMAQVEQAQAEITALKAERDHVRDRVEVLLKQLDALEL
jgi:chromosome segregation ATPase